MQESICFYLAAPVELRSKGNGQRCVAYIVLCPERNYFVSDPTVYVFCHNSWNHGRLSPACSVKISNCSSFSMKGKLLRSFFSHLNSKYLFYGKNRILFIFAPSTWHLNMIHFTVSRKHGFFTTNSLTQRHSHCQFIPHLSPESHPLESQRGSMAPGQDGCQGFLSCIEYFYTLTLLF